MPKLIKAYFRDYRISLSLFIILIVFIFSHQLFITSALRWEASRVDHCAEVMQEQTRAIREATQAFNAASMLIDKGTAQSKLNYELLIAVRETQLQALEMLFIPIEERAKSLKDIPSLQNFKTKPLPPEIKDHD